MSDNAVLNGTSVTEVQIPRIGLGTSPLTGGQCREAVGQALDSGYRHIDTAENYANEDAVGQAVAESGLRRSEVFVTTKFNRDSHGDVATVRSAAERALQRLGLDYLDLLLVHWPNPDQDRYVRSCESLAALVETGLVRSWGVSNFKPHHLEKVLEAGLVPPVNQIQVDPHHAQRSIERANTGAGVLTAAYSPLGRGGAVLEDPAVRGPAERLNRTPAQIVLRWHLQHGRVAIPRSADTTRQRQNLDVLSFELSAEEMTAIDAVDTGAGARLDADEFGH